jgi:hypothetical protein
MTSTSYQLKKELTNVFSPGLMEGKLIDKDIADSPIAVDDQLEISCAANNHFPTFELCCNKCLSNSSCLSLKPQTYFCANMHNALTKSSLEGGQTSGWS